MIELLNICGFEAQELESELPRIKKAFDRMGITKEDIERAKQRLSTYYDVELTGIRKILRLCILDLVNLVMAREDGKTIIVYGYMSLVFRALLLVFMSKSREAHFAMPYQVSQIVLGCVFGKLNPIMEEAERMWLRSGVFSHCANLKTVVGLMESNLIPKPDFIVTSGYLCDTAPKTADLLQELYDIPIFYQDTCQDRLYKDYPYAKGPLELFSKNLRRSVGEIQEAVGVEITDDFIWEVLSAQGKLSSSLGRLQDLLENSDPMPISPTHDVLIMALRQLSRSSDDMEEIIDAVDTLYEEVLERVNRGVGVVDKGSPRVLAVLPPHSTDPRLEHLICETGIALVSQELGLYPPDGRHRPSEGGKSEDPYMEISLPLLSSLASNTLGGRISILKGACERLNVDGVLIRSHVGCRHVAGDVILIKNAITNELGIPALLLEWENFDPRVFDHEQYRYRRDLELFKTMLTSGNKKT
ncbi:2-hydroxyacyl-CoA dehydratase [Thermodesulfobacteriota bacterium]